MMIIVNETLQYKTLFGINHKYCIVKLEEVSFTSLVQIIIKYIYQWKEVRCLVHLTAFQCFRQIF